MVQRGFLSRSSSFLMAWVLALMFWPSAVSKDWAVQEVEMVVDFMYEAPV